MKGVAILLAIFAISPSLAFASDVEDVVSALVGAVPPDWQSRLDPKVHPPWSRSNDTCVELILYGPARGGYSYFDVQGRELSEKRFSHEAVLLHITPKAFHSGWNVVSRALNWLSPWAVDIPDRLAEHQGVAIYGKETYWAEGDRIKEQSPAGARTAVFSPPENGRTWRTWRNDLRQAIAGIASNKAL